MLNEQQQQQQLQQQYEQQQQQERQQREQKTLEKYKNFESYEKGVPHPMEQVPKKMNHLYLQVKQEQFSLRRKISHQVQKLQVKELKRN